MLIAALLIAFLVVAVAMAFRPQYADVLMPLACLLGAALLLIVLQDSGLWPEPGNVQGARSGAIPARP